jgi:hypothetical protein
MRRGKGPVVGRSGCGPLHLRQNSEKFDLRIE